MEETIKTKRCAKCGRELPVTEFYKSKANKDGLQSYCKECGAMSSKNSCETQKNVALVKVFSNPELAKFQPRELMLELKARGFRWEYMLEPQRKIMYDKLR